MVKKVLLVLLMTAGFAGYSANISADQARTVAVNWLNSLHESEYTLGDILKVDSIAGENNTELYVVCFNSAGWVMVSGVDAAEPVLGYSTTSVFDIDHLPVQLKDWIRGMTDELDVATGTSYIPSSLIEEKWNSLAGTIREPGQLKSTMGISVGPLLSTQWNQGKYFNEMAPVDPSSSAGNGHVWIGCVATSMAQIMKYQAYPVSGTGSHSYVHSSYGTQSADFENTVYDWASMPNKPGTILEEVDRISYHCAVSVDMDFGPSGSGAYLDDCESALETFFKYNTTAFGSEKSRWDDEEWKQLIRSDIDAGRPIIYSGYNASYTSGHAWVCDGYNDTHFHFNWGWSGYADGYYLLSALTPGSANYSYNQEAVFGIEPVVAQPMSFPYVESFESGTFGKYSAMGVARVTVGTSSSGLCSVMLGKEGFTSGADNSLSLTFLVPKGAFISFWVKRYTPQSSAKNKQSASLLTELGTTSLISFFEGDFNDSEWVSYQADLSSYEGQVVRLLFQQVNRDVSKDQWMYIDNIAITGIHENLPPYIPANPNPQTNSVGITQSPLLRWTGGDPNGDDVLYKVYLSPTNPPTLAGSTYNRSFPTETLQYKTKYYWCIAANDGQAEVTGEVWNFTTQGIPPDVETCGVSNITSTSARVCNRIVSVNQAVISERGICWSVNDMPTVDNEVVTANPELNPTYGYLSNLKPCLDYFVRAYAVSNEGIGYGSIIKFKTQSAAPELITGTVTDIKRSSATLNGLVTQMNDSVIVAYGVEWSISDGFLTGSGKKVEIEGRWDNLSQFQVTVSGLPGPDTVYYRLFVTNSVGTSYSAQGMFVTQNTAPFIDLDADNSTGLDGSRFKGRCFERNSQCLLADQDLLIEDQDGDTIRSVMIELLNPVPKNQEYIVLNQPDERFSAEGNNSTKLTISSKGVMDHGIWKTLIRSVGLMIDDYAPNTTVVRQVGLSVSDGIDTSLVATAYLTVVPVNDAPVNLTLPQVEGTVKYGSVVTATTGTWVDSLDRCTGPVSYSYQWQGMNLPEGEVFDLEAETTNSLLITEALCQMKLRVKILAVDSHCGGSNDATGVAWSEWFQTEKGTQTIKIDPIPVKKFSRIPFVITGSSSSGFPLSYSIPNESLARISNDTVYMKGVGTAVISALQLGNACFQPSAKKYTVLEIQKGDQTISFDLPERIAFNDQYVVLKAFSDSDLPITFDPDPFTLGYINQDTLFITGTGQLTITAHQEGNSLYNPAPLVTKTIEVEKGEQAILFEPVGPLKYGMPPVSIDVRASSGLPVSIKSSDESVLRVEDQKIEILGAGPCSLIISQEGNENWNAARDSVFSVIVAKGEPELKVEIPEMIRLNDLNVVPVITSLINEECVIEVADTTICTVQNQNLILKNAGTTLVSFSLVGNSLWENDTVTIQLVVNKGFQVIEFDSIPAVIYADALTRQLSAEATSGLELSFLSDNDKVAIVEGNLLKIKGAGSAIIQARQEGNSNWEAAEPVVVTLEVEKAGQQIFSTLPDTLTTRDRVIKTGIYSSSGLPVVVESEDQSVVVVQSDSIRIVDAGEVWLRAAQAGNSNYWPVESRIRLQVIYPVLSDQMPLLRFELFPNPAGRSVSLSVNGPLQQPACLKVINFGGEVIESRIIDQPVTRFNLDRWASGVYLFVVQIDKNVLCKKLMVR